VNGESSIKQLTMAIVLEVLYGTNPGCFSKLKALDSRFRENDKTIFNPKGDSLRQVHHFAISHFTINGPIIK
jgi:hypothetical protein